MEAYSANDLSSYDQTSLVRGKASSVRGGRVRDCVAAVGLDICRRT